MRNLLLPFLGLLCGIVVFSGCKPAPVQEVVKQPTTQELFERTRSQFSAGALHGALETALQIHVEPSETNVHETSLNGYDEYDDSVADNEYYQIDSLLSLLAKAFLKAKQSDEATLAANRIDQPRLRDQTLFEILNAQSRVVIWHDLPEDEIRKMHVKSLRTFALMKFSGYSDSDKLHDGAWVLVTYQTARFGHFLAAIDASRNIKETSRRESVLEEIILGRRIVKITRNKDDKDEVFSKAMSEIESPLLKLLIPIDIVGKLLDQYRYGNYREVSADIKEKAKKYLALSLATTDSIPRKPAWDESGYGFYFPQSPDYYVWEAVKYYKRLDSPEGAKEVLQFITKDAKKNGNTNALWRVADFYQNQLNMLPEAKDILQWGVEYAKTLDDPAKKSNIYYSVAAMYQAINSRRSSPVYTKQQVEEMIRLAFEENYKATNDEANERFVQILALEMPDELRTEILNVYSNRKQTLGDRLIFIRNELRRSANIKNDNAEWEKIITRLRMQLVQIGYDIKNNPDVENANISSLYLVKNWAELLVQMFRHKQYYEVFDIIDSAIVYDDFKEEVAFILASRYGDDTEILHKLLERLQSREHQRRVITLIKMVKTQKSPQEWMREIEFAQSEPNTTLRFNDFMTIFYSTSSDAEKATAVSEMMDIMEHNDELPETLGFVTVIRRILNQYQPQDANQKNEMLAKVESRKNELFAQFEKIIVEEQDDVKRFQYRRSLVSTMWTYLHDDESEKLFGMIEQEYDAAKEITTSGERLNAYGDTANHAYWLAGRARFDPKFTGFAQKVIGEAIAYAETLPDKGLSSPKTADLVKQIERTKTELTERLANRKK